MITIIWYVSTIERKSETYVMSLPQPYYLKLSDLLQIIDVKLPNTEFTQWYVNIIKTISRFKIYEKCCLWINNSNTIILDNIATFYLLSVMHP